MPKLTKNSPAMIRLRNKFEAGEITVDDTPKSVWESDPLFRNHKLNNFRAQFNNLKREYLLSDQHQSPSPFGLRPRCSNELASSTKRPKLIEDAEEVEDEEDEELDLSVQKEQCDTASHAFSPLYLISNWKENSTMRKRLTIAVLLPSGVEQGTFSIRVLEGGKVLEITVRWPKPLLDFAMLHKMFLRNPSGQYKNYHPEYIGFEESLRNLRANKMDWVESTTQINLPFAVETHIHEKFNLCWEGSSAKVLYIRLKAVVEQYGISHDNEEFIVL